MKILAQKTKNENSLSRLTYKSSKKNLTKYKTDI